jgi:HEAT repeat protein
LLEFLRRRSAQEIDPEKIAALVSRLSGDAATARKACAEVLAIGPAAIPALRAAARDVDQAQAAAMARRCLSRLEHNSGSLSGAVVRVLAKEHPSGAVPALLEFLPHADDEGVAEEVHSALVAVVRESGTADPALIAALEDPAPVRRALAVNVLCQGGVAGGASTIRKLLQDPAPSVRLRAALGLSAANDPKAVSTLITLLDELPINQAREAEELLIELAGNQAPQVALEADADSRRRCRDAWAAWWLESERPEPLLDAFHKRTLTEEVRLKAIKLIEQLGDDDFRTRERAASAIKKLGGIMVPLLRQATHSHDVEVRQRAEGCLSEIEQNKDTPLAPAVPRLIGLRRPSGAAEAILGYLPFAEDESLVEEVQKALNRVAGSAGKVEPAVLRALTDAAPARRAAAAEAICYVCATEHYPAVRRLLKDPQPMVRVKTALALAGARESDAVEALIQFVGELPPSEAAFAEDYLLRLSADQQPTGLPSGEGDAQRKRRDLWAAWWAANKARVHLVDRYPTRAEEPRATITLAVNLQGSQVVALGADNKVRWEMNGLLGPQDAQLLPGGRVLVAEANGQRVTERNLKGDILWQKSLPGAWPTGAQRLRNGNTLIICRNQLQEVDRSGREVYTIPRPANDVVAARRMANGQIVCVTAQRQVVRLDTSGKEIKSFTVPMLMQNGIEVLADGHVLLPVIWTNKVTEYDADGKTVADLAATQPMAACKLSRGHYMVAVQQGPPKLVEMDKDGKVVAEVPMKFPSYRLVRR